jgi:hypothetical protein
MIQAASGPVLQLHDVAGHYGVGSFVGELPAEEVLPQARSVHHQRRGDDSTLPLMKRTSR